LNVASGKKALLDMIQNNANDPFDSNIFQVDAFWLLRFEDIDGLENKQSITYCPMLDRWYIRIILTILDMAKAIANASAN
jgi:hypothetical protein